MTDLLDTELATRFDDAAIDGVIRERHHNADAPAELLPPKVRRKATRVAKAQVWDSVSNVRGVLGPGKALTPEEICRQTGLMPAQCGAALCKLESEGDVRRVGDRWEMVFPNTV